MAGSLPPSQEGQVPSDKDERLVCSWIFRFRNGRRDRKERLGPLTTVSLAQARERAAEAGQRRENEKARSSASNGPR